MKPTQEQIKEFKGSSGCFFSSKFEYNPSYVEEMFATFRQTLENINKQTKLNLPLPDAIWQVNKTKKVKKKKFFTQEEYEKEDVIEYAYHLIWHTKLEPSIYDTLWAFKSAFIRGANFGGRRY